jgi:hypothetical protein
MTEYESNNQVLKGCSWVDMTLFPSTMLAGALLATVGRRWKLALERVACGTIALAVLPMVAR